MDWNLRAQQVSACLNPQDSCTIGTLDVVVGFGCLIGAIVALRSLVGFIDGARARSLTPTASRLLSRLLRTRERDENAFFAADGAPDAFAARRREGFLRLAEQFAERGDTTSDLARELRSSFSDLRFADANRVPPGFGRMMREHFDLSTVVTESRGPRLRDTDGNWSLDVSGSYGVNVVGHEKYKEFFDRGWERVRDLGPTVLGPVHPIVAENVERLKAISGCEEVSFHMSGTEAVMAAVRLARFNTGRKKIVTFSGAYHGWWDGVQPGVGSERPIDDCLTLKDLDPKALDLLRRRAGDIAAVLINPVQSFHPNSPPPNDAVLLTSEVRKTDESTDRYRDWLHALRRVCTEAGIPLIFDEVYSGFRLAPGGAQEFYGVQADMVLYGKTLGGGMPVGVVCGSQELMRRFDPERPMRLAYVVGTFSAHPFVMATMNEFLRWLATPEAKQSYEAAHQACSTWATQTNRELADHGLPIRIAHLGTIWTVLFEEPGRYNWLLQYYLRAQGLSLSWVGTGRCLASLDYESSDYDELREKIVAGALAMKADAWWLSRQEDPKRDTKLKLELAKELASSLVQLPRPLRAFYADIMQRKHDDHVTSHHEARNQALHLLSSSVFIACYGLVFTNLTMAMYLGLGALFWRQIGHAIFEPVHHEEEKLLLGFTTKSKTFVVGVYMMVPIVHFATNGWSATGNSLATIAWQWWLWTLTVVFGRVAFLAWKHGLRNSLIWFTKLVTDPFTDVVTYRPKLFLANG